MIGSLDRPRTMRWLMSLRAVAAATLLVCSLAINLIFGPGDPLGPFYLLAGAVFLLVLAWAAAYRRWAASAGFAAAQVAGHLAIVTGFVWASGGARSPMSFLYIVPIVTAGMTLGRAGAYCAAAVAWICQVGVVLGTVTEVLPVWPGGILDASDMSPLLVWYLIVS